jgi:hypothetical protein
MILDIKIVSAGYHSLSVVLYPDSALQIQKEI